MAKSKGPNGTRGGNGAYSLKKKLPKPQPRSRTKRLPREAVKKFQTGGEKI